MGVQLSPPQQIIGYANAYIKQQQLNYKDYGKEEYKPTQCKESKE